MKKLLAVGLVLALSGCGGGYDSLPPQVSDGNGGTIGAGGTFPTDKGDWKYRSVSNEDGVFSLSASIYATNTYTVPKYPNLKQRSWIELEKRKMADDTISKRFTIFAPEEVKCTPNCQIRIKFNGNTATYSFLQSTEGVLTPVSEQSSSELFDKTVQSNKATVYLPIVGLSKEFGSEFNLRGYDAAKMKFISE
ncbi:MULTISPECIES: hypothetical protein [Psychrobacter]|uniref:hypothetical protein n=1 Tax=Psychrobacter TaxID=497 RepID=UPI000EC40E47|nr:MULTISPECIES: hypothetical protein [Psychrobacter]HCH26974.1 hypothetical protein [Psychrobacter sp.]